MIVHMAAVDISAFDSWEVLKECCTENSPWAPVVYLSTYILIQSICLRSHLVDNLMEQMGVISKKKKCIKNPHKTDALRQNPGMFYVPTQFDVYAFATPAASLCGAHLFFSVANGEIWVKFKSNSVKDFTASHNFQFFGWNLHLVWNRLATTIYSIEPTFSLHRSAQGSMKQY